MNLLGCLHSFGDDRSMKCTAKGDNSFNEGLAFMIDQHVEYETLVNLELRRR